MAALCRRVTAGELTAEAAVRAAPFPEATARDALTRAAVTARTARDSNPQPPGP